MKDKRLRSFYRKDKSEKISRVGSILSPTAPEKLPYLVFSYFRDDVSVHIYYNYGQVIIK